MKNFVKITFKDKEDAVNVSNDSKYVLTASNINEIKDVVNSLSDELTNLLTYDQIFKYIRFNVSSGLEKNIFYSLKIELSENSNFENSIEIICYPTLTLGESNYSLEEDSTSIFSIFKNGSWISYKNLILTNNDENSEIKINIQSYISNKNENNIPFFGRYKLINLNTLEESEWSGFSLGYSNYKNSPYFLPELKEVKIIGKTEIFGKSTNSYDLIGIDSNNNEVLLTENLKFSLITQSTSSFIQNILSTPNVITEEVQIIKAECLYNEITYIAYLPIYIKPLQILQYYIEGPSKIIEGTEEEYLIKAICKDGKILDLTNESSISLESENLSYRIENNKLIIKNKEIASDNEVCVINAIFIDNDTNIKYYTSKTLYASKILYNDFKIDFQYQNNDEKRMVTYDENCLFSLGLLNNEIFNNIKFKISLFNSSLNQLEKTNDIKIYEIGSSYLNIETIKITENNNTEFIKKISLNSLDNIDGEKEIVLLFVYIEPTSGKSIVKPYSIKIFSIPLSGNIKELLIQCSKNTLLNNDSGTYIIYGISLINEMIDLSNVSNVEIITPISGVSINTNNQTILTSNLSENGVGYIKVSYNNLIKYEDLYFIKN